jgi:hypothetical protein
VRPFVGVIALVMTAFGIGWMSVRTHAVDSAMSQVAVRDEPLVISTWSHLFREGGAFYTPERRWLTAETRPQLDRALQIAEAEQLWPVAIVSVGPNPVDPGVAYRTMRVEHIEFFDDQPLTVTVVEPRVDQ